jgi:hypothetical protein
MADTRIAPTPAMKARTAVGYTLEMKPAASWDFGALEGAARLFHVIAQKNKPSEVRSKSIIYDLHLEPSLPD